jgi:hypothetical protein
MTLKKVKENTELLQLLANSKNKKLVHNILSNSDDSFLKLLREIVNNLLYNKKIDIPPKTRHILTKNKHILRNIVHNKSEKKLKKKILNIPCGKGGWFSILAPILGTILGGFLKKLF